MKVIKLSYNKVFIQTGLFICLLGFSNCTTKVDDCLNTKPNILFIMTDDQGSWTLSSESYSNAYTPQLDKLAEQGILVRNAFAVSTVCSPSRAALFSGRYPSETGILDYIPNGSEAGVDTTLLFWPELFKDVGYKTALVGKWHLGSAYKAHFPEQRGFDYFSGFLIGGEQSKNPTVYLEGKDTVFTNQYTPDVLTDLAVKYIRKFKNDPWVVCLHFWAPHANTSFPEGFNPPYNDRSWLPLQDIDLEYWKEMKLVLPNPDFPCLDTSRIRRMMREYYASVYSVDRNVGRLMNLLEEMNHDKNTIVIFTSDHGYMLGHHGLWHKGNGRWITTNKIDPTGLFQGEERPNLYDLSLRVPLIIRWPNHLKAGKKIDKNVTFLDLYPTLLEMADIEKSSQLILRGKSFFPLLKDLEQEWNNTFFAQYKTLRSVQTSEWKYVYNFSDTLKNELYNLKLDSGENFNIIYSTNKRVIKKKAELHRLLFKEMKEINDPIFH